MQVVALCYTHHRSRDCQSRVAVSHINEPKSGHTRTVRVTLRPRSTVASQQTTRQAWANATGQFAFYPHDTIRSSAQVPEVFRKRSQWRTDSGREDGYYSHTEAEPNLFIPVEFDSRPLLLGRNPVDHRTRDERSSRPLASLSNSKRRTRSRYHNRRARSIHRKRTIHTRLIPSTTRSHLPLTPEHHHQQHQAPAVAQAISTYSPILSVHKRKNSFD